MSENLDIKENLLINNNKQQETIIGDRSEEIEILKSMGFEEDLIKTIYKNIKPADLQDAIDYLNKNEKGKFTHSFLINENNLCSICGKGRKDHESDTIFVENDNNEIDIVDNLLGNRRGSVSNTHKYNTYENSYRKSLGKKKDNNAKDDLSPKECGICYEPLENINEVKLTCGHYFCKDCWTDYLKEKITNANVVKISCMQNKCEIILEEKFIKNILKGNNELLDKYDKFYKRKKIIEQKNNNIRSCPFPDCEGYAQKIGKDKYVKCNYGHEFCFECGSVPHGKKKCSEMIDKSFDEWRSQRVVKRCPYCKMWTEKNEGCNHMTCVECRFQWCWLCQGPYGPNHFDQGACKGLQFYSEKDEKKIKAKLEENRLKYPGPSKCVVFLCTLWKCFAYIFFAGFLKFFSNSIGLIEDNTDYFPEAAGVFCMLTNIPMLVAFELFFVSCTIIITIPCLFYPPLFRKLKFYIVYRLFQF